VPCYADREATSGQGLGSEASWEALVARLEAADDACKARESSRVLSVSCRAEEGMS
jgi:hypothetical protein